MSATRDARDPAVMAGYEPLVRTTALLIVSRLGQRAEPYDALDDVMQLLRVKVWQALGYFGPERMPRKRGESATRTRDRFVFMCLMNVKKDIIKRKRVPELMIEDYAPLPPEYGTRRHTPARDQFEARYMARSADDTFASVENQPPLIPNTLTNLERMVLLLLYRDYRQWEIAKRLAVSENQVSLAVRALREKLADWRPPPAAAPLPQSAEVAA